MLPVARRLFFPKVSGRSAFVCGGSERLYGFASAVSGCLLCWGSNWCGSSGGLHVADDGGEVVDVVGGGVWSSRFAPRCLPEHRRQGVAGALRDQAALVLGGADDGVGGHFTCRGGSVEVQIGEVQCPPVARARSSSVAASLTERLSWSSFATTSPAVCPASTAAMAVRALGRPLSVLALIPSSAAYSATTVRPLRAA